jgi:hypothetical protein
MTQDGQITRTAFAQVPIQLLEQCSDRSLRGCLFVYLWLWHYAGIQDQAFPSVPRLAAECHMNLEDTRKALRWLTVQGWIRRIDRPGQTTLFHIRTEKCPRSTPTPKGTPLRPKAQGDPYARRRTPPLRPKGEGTPTPEGTPNKNHLTRTNEQEVETLLLPFEPTPPEPPAAPSAEPAPKRPKGPFTPTEADVPEALLPVAIDLLDFWEGKGGRKTLNAWTRLLKQLVLIQGDVAGGTEVVREQLEAGIQTGWQSLTHKNWHRYGRQGPETLRLPNGSSRSKLQPREEFFADFADLRAKGAFTV